MLIKGPTDPNVKMGRKTARAGFIAGDGYDPDAQDYFTRVESTGATLSDGCKTRLDTLFTGL